MAKRSKRTNDKASGNFSRQKARWKKLRALQRIEAKLDSPTIDSALAEDLELEAEGLAARICPDSVVMGFIRGNHGRGE